MFIAKLPVEAALNVLPQVGLTAGLGNYGNASLHIPLKYNLNNAHRSL